MGRFILSALACLAFACGSKASTSQNSSSSSAQPPNSGKPSSSVAGAPGAGDKSGSSSANAKELVKGKPVEVSVPCKGRVYFGPFTFSKDPSKIELSAELVNDSSQDQICAGGWWVDGAERFVENARIGCVEKKLPRKDTFAAEYSPHNGGSNANPIYLQLGFDEDQPDGCQSIRVKLNVP
jgi:hypothetical protein